MKKQWKFGLPEKVSLDLETRLAGEAFWKKIFGGDNEPLKEIKLGSRYQTIPSWFPSKKNPRGEIRAREPLMADLLVHLDTDPDVKWILEFAVALEIRVHKPDGSDFVEKHIPDILMMDARGAVFVIDVMPFHVQPTFPLTPYQKASRERHYAGLGAKYLLLNETSLHVRPLFPNLIQMWRHKRRSHEHRRMERIRQRIRDHKLDCTIGDLMRSMPENAFIGRWSDEPASAAKHISTSNPIFTAVMQLAMMGEVDVDLDTRFSAETRVTRRSKAHG